MPKRRTARVLLPLALALGVVLPAFGQGPGGRGGPSPVRVAEVLEQRISEEVRLTGTVDAKRFARVSVEFPGIIEEVFVDEGDLVQRGEPMLRLRDRSARYRLDQARAEMAIEQARLEELENGERQEDIDAALAEVREARANLLLAEQERSRVRELLETRTASQAEFDRASAEHDRSAADLARLEAVYQRLRAGARTEALAQARAEVASAQARVLQLEFELASHTLRAPFTGIVGEKRAEAGQWISSGTEAFTLAELDPLRLRVNLPERHFARVRPGDEVSISFDALPDESFVRPITARIPLGSTSSRTFPILVDLENSEYRLAPGMLARVAVEIGDRGEEPVVLAPKDAIVSNGPGSRRVWVVEDREEGQPSVVRAVDVAVGREWRDFVEITSEGLEAGQRVVIRGNEILRPGQEVRVQVPAPAPAEDGPRQDSPSAARQTAERR